LDPKSIFFLLAQVRGYCRDKNEWIRGRATQEMRERGMGQGERGYMR